MKLSLGTCIVALIGLVGCSNPPASDVTDNLRTSLNEADLTDVSVSQDRDKRVVTLSGDVRTDAEKSRAEAIVTMGAAGHAVANEITVQPTSSAPDPWLTLKTKIALMTTEGVSTSDLNVDTVDGVVTLHGTVPTQMERDRAESVAGDIDGVRGIRNLLQVVPGAQREIVQRSDAAIKEGVEAAFDANRRIMDSGIKVASVNKGVALLSGKSTSLEASLEAVEVASAVRGVRRVATEVEVVPAS